MTYEQLVSQYISEKYTLSQEIAIQRQRDTKPKEFAEYNSYCEECKVRAKANINAYNAEQERIAKERYQADETEAKLYKQKEAERESARQAKEAERKTREEERKAARKLQEEERAKERTEQKAKRETERAAREETRKNKTKAK